MLFSMVYISPITFCSVLNCFDATLVEYCSGNLTFKLVFFADHIFLERATCALVLKAQNKLKRRMGKAHLDVNVEGKKRCYFFVCVSPALQYELSPGFLFVLSS